MLGKRIESEAAYDMAIQINMENPRAYFNKGTGYKTKLES
jgi:hypothetical protein